MIARLLFTSLLNALLIKVDSELNSKDAAELMQKINASLVNMLTNSTQFYAPFIACLLVSTALLHYTLQCIGLVSVCLSLSHDMAELMQKIVASPSPTNMLTS